MKSKTITEFVKLEVLQTTTDEQMLMKADVINDFISKQDGFVDSEIVKPLEGNIWYFVYHIESIDKLRVVGEKIRSQKLFDVLNPFIAPGSMTVTFCQQLKKW